MQSCYAVIFRTHVWDEGIGAQAERARASCGSGKFVVAADETNGPLQVEGFTKLPHADDFSEFNLPKIPADKVLWWNADYVLYAARRALPDYDYYIMIEYDVYLNCDVDRIITQCSENKVDFVAQYLKRIGPNDHWSSQSVSEMGGDLWWALIPFIIVSGRAVDEMLKTRQALAARLATGEISNWPYCEPFLPTAVAARPDFTTWSLDRFVDSTLLRWRPYLSSRDPQLYKTDIVAHPVLSGERFIRAFIGSHPSATRHVADGLLSSELQNEEGDNLQAVFGDQVRIRRNLDGKWSLTNNITPRQPEIFRPRADVAYGKPATQSSHSRWSRGASTEADAAFANHDPLPDEYAFHTDVEENPWWQVNLLELCLVEQIELINRASNFLRFTRFRIDTSRDGNEWTACFVKLDDTVVSNDPNYPAKFNLNHPVQAQYIRIIQLGTNAMHLRRVRVLGYPLISSAAATADHMTSATFARLLAEPENHNTLSATIESVVHQRVLGRGYDSYNIDTLAFLAAGVDSSLYAMAHMGNAKRFPNAGSLHDYAVVCTPASGMVLEFGVFSGTSINRIANQMPGRRVYGFDSFEGLPEPWRPGFAQGAFRRADLPSVAGNVELVIGWFDSTLPAFVATKPSEKLALLHVDCDLYSSTKTIFTFLADRIVPGTIIIFDEYFNYPEWRMHEFKAFQELLDEHVIAYDYIGLVPSHQQVVVRVTDVG